VPTRARRCGVAVRSGSDGEQRWEVGRGEQHTGRGGEGGARGGAGWVEGMRGRRAYALRARGGEGGAVLAVGYRKKGGRKN